MGKIIGTAPGSISGSVGNYTYRNTKDGYIVSEKRKKSFSKKTLRQFIMRFSIENDQGNTLFCAKVYDTLPDEFSTQRLAAAIRTAGRKTPARNVVYRWKLSGVIEEVEKGKYKKVKNES